MELFLCYQIINSRILPPYPLPLYYVLDAVSNPILSYSYLEGVELPKPLNKMQNLLKALNRYREKTDSDSVRQVGRLTQKHNRTLCKNPDLLWGLAAREIPKNLLILALNTSVQLGSLEGVDLSGARLDSVDLRGANLKEANLSKTRFYRSSLNQARLDGAFALGAEFLHSDLGAVWARRVCFDRARFVDSHMGFAQLAETYFIEANIKRCNFQYANLQFASFQQATLSESILKRAKMEGVVLLGTQFHDIQFEQVSFFSSQRYLLNSLGYKEEDLQGCYFSKEPNMEIDG